MAKILNYYPLCPINDVEEFLGLSHGAESGTIINTLGRNIISIFKVSFEFEYVFITYTPIMFTFFFNEKFRFNYLSISS